MTGRYWPRRAGEDPLLPKPYPAPATLSTPIRLPSGTGGRSHVITARATALACSRAAGATPKVGCRRRARFCRRHAHHGCLKRARMPRHAFSEADRLLARPARGRSFAVDFRPPMPAGAIGERRRSPAMTVGLRADHPIIARAIAQVQSATSLRLMLRDPLAFVWRYALGWRSLVEDDQPLCLDARAFGELVHELLKRAVDALEPHPGYARAARLEIESALDARSPRSRPMAARTLNPALLLWRHTLDAARDLALKALTLDEAFQPGTRSWTEMAFGRDERRRRFADGIGRRCEVPIPGTPVRIRGRIDRLDLNAAAAAVRLSDYKTGAEPKQADQIVLGRGAELQRVVYAVAARHLLPDNPHVVARLVFLGDDSPHPYRLADVDAAIAEAAAPCRRRVRTARPGTALPGPDAHDGWNDYRLALPAGAGDLFPDSSRRPSDALSAISRASGAPMMRALGQRGRLRALTELESTLLVESAAGTGKTALMAGRLTMLLASGVEPGSVAAITFTEMAASELSARIHRFVDELLAGRSARTAAPGVARRA